MSQPLVIDPRRFAREGRVLAGTLPVARLLRVHDLLVEVTGELTYRLDGRQGERGQARLQLAVDGVLPLVCQRCLAAVDTDLAIDSLLELLPEGSAPTQDELENDDMDFLPVGDELDVLALIEDEILLALPVAPRHTACALPAAAETDEKAHPFAALAAWKVKPN